MIFYLILLLLSVSLLVAIVQAVRLRRRCRRLQLENRQLFDSLDRLRVQVRRERQIDPWAFVSQKPSGLGKHA